MFVIRHGDTKDALLRHKEENNEDIKVCETREVPRPGGGGRDGVGCFSHMGFDFTCECWARAVTLSRILLPCCLGR
jgi:hypothetical protein